MLTVEVNLLHTDEERKRYKVCLKSDPTCVFWVEKEEIFQQFQLVSKPSERICHAL